MNANTNPMLLNLNTPWKKLGELARRAIRTDDGVVGLLSRLGLGAVILPHGGQHFFGWFGGYGFDGTHGWMVKTLGIPAALAAVAIVLEVVAPLLVLAGAGGRFAAAWLAGFMTVAGTTHASNGFFMNWPGNHAGEGFEYHILAVTLALVVLVTGSGKASVDRALTHIVEVRRAASPG